jgi:predicted glycoside hydrolase/deacetylase ChbG (UPF0249 family)
LQGEVGEQIDRCREAGIGLTHADSHNHSHAELPVFISIVPVLKRKGIKYVRLSDNVRRASFLRRAYKIVFNSTIALCGLRGTKYFTDFTNLAGLRQALASGDSAVELMVHPAYAADGTLIDLTTKLPLAELVRLLPQPCRLGSYGDLSK